MQGEKEDLTYITNRSTGNIMCRGKKKVKRKKGQEENGKEEKGKEEKAKRKRQRGKVKRKTRWGRIGYRRRGAENRQDKREWCCGKKERERVTV
jgi:hypothetical protein